MARVFIDMLPDDDLDAARAEAARTPDARASAFHDPEQRAGRAAARSMGWTRDVAWDVFLVYGPSVAWVADDVPPPAAWFHQLNDGEDPERSEPDPARFRTGDGLRRALADAIRDAARAAPPGRE